MPTFILNDETKVNSYGFRVRNSGISLSRFTTNPVMLDSHINQTSAVLGKWKNWMFDGYLFKADTDFDTSKPSAKDVAGQVDRGYVRGCSMGLGINFDDDAWFLAPDGIYDLVKSELVEGSICAVPSNAASVALINASTGKPINANEFKLNLSAVTPRGITLNTPAQRQGVFLQVLTPDEFMKLTTTEQLNYKNNNNAAYLQTVDMLRPNKKPLHSAQPTRLTYDDVRTLDDFMRMSTADQLNFKINFEASYLRLFNRTTLLPSATQLINKQTDYYIDRLNDRFGSATLSSYSHVKTIDDFERLPNADKLNFKNTCNAQYMALWRR